MIITLGFKRIGSWSSCSSTFIMSSNTFEQKCSLFYSQYLILPFIYRRFSSADAPKILENGIPIESVNSGTKK